MQRFLRTVMIGHAVTREGAEWLLKRANRRKRVRVDEADSVVAGAPVSNRCDDHAADRGRRMSPV